MWTRSSRPGCRSEPAIQGLKPAFLWALNGTAEAVPSQKHLLGSLEFLLSEVDREGAFHAPAGHQIVLCIA
jgi:hypothetical protein